jgi:hypothetical protein
MDDDNPHAVLEAFARHHRRSATTFAVACLFLIALIAAT